MKISIITVCFNSAAHIAHTLRSVDEQSWQDKEHIVVDGASRDDTMQIVQAHPQTWRRALSEPDRGIYDAMNKGIALAVGDVVGFINSDDFYASPTALEKVAAVFADPQVEGCWGDLCYVKQDHPEQVVRYWRSSEFRPGMFARGWCPPHPTLFLRRSVFQTLGCFDLSYPIAADMELMARLIEVHRISSRYLPEVLVHMRMGGTTNRSWSNIWRQNREIWRALHEHSLSPSLLNFVGSKLAARAQQFLSRPAP
jgi:glycosyltransferase involved in cell wall biosynthesis